LILLQNSSDPDLDKAIRASLRDEQRSVIEEQRRLAAIAAAHRRDRPVAEPSAPPADSVPTTPQSPRSRQPSRSPGRVQSSSRSRSRSPHSRSRSRSASSRSRSASVERKGDRSKSRSPIRADIKRPENVRDRFITFVCLFASLVVLPSRCHSVSG